MLSLWIENMNPVSPWIVEMGSTSLIHFLSMDCGYPGFEVHCNNGSTILRISENDFIVMDIKYGKHRFRLQNSAILSHGTDYCPSTFGNLTLEPNRFVIDDEKTTKLLSISKCPNNMSTDLEKYRIRSCEKSKEYVMVENDGNLRNLMDGCGSGVKVVEMPVELDGGEGGSMVVDGGNYTGVVERGFEMGRIAVAVRVVVGGAGLIGHFSNFVVFATIAGELRTWLKLRVLENNSRNLWLRIRP